jgi:cell division protein FtsL
MAQKLEDMQKAIKDQLKKDNPDWSEDKLEQTSMAIAKDRFAKMKKENLKMDEKGRIIVGENVKLIITANIASADGSIVG